MSEPLVVVGNGMAAARLCEELTERACGRYAIAVVGEEPRLAYNRVLLSSLLADEISAAEVELKPARWWRDRGVTLIYGRPAVAIDPTIRRVRLADGATLPFSKLVIATGSRPIRLPLPGMDLPGVKAFRDLADVAELRRAAPGARAVVIGGGLLGLEAAYGLAKGGATVTLVHLMDRLMERQLDARAALMLRREVEARGVEVLLGAETKCVAGRRRVEGVTLTDGRTIPADLVVVAIGVRPNAEIARTAGLTVNRGIVVDDRLETSERGIYAIGECAEHNGQCYGIVEPAYEHARLLAQGLLGSDQRYTGSVLATNLKVSGVRVFSAGDFIGAPGTEALVLSDPGLKTYKKLVIAHDRLVGAVLFGDTADGPWYLDVIRSGRRVDTMRDELVFGRAFADAIAETPCPQINHEQKLGKHQPERAAHLTYNIPAGLAHESQTADLT
jgi:nitrite reductase (NADH) large subunit